jgi:transposase
MVRKETSGRVLARQGPAEHRGQQLAQTGLSIEKRVCSMTGTMVRLQLDERQWQKIEAALGGRKGAGRPGRDNRNFVEAVLWWRRTGAPWRDLRSEFGPWKTVFNRFDRWASKGIWQRLFDGLRLDHDDEWHSIDSTINRAHQHAAGAKGGHRRRASAVRVVA